MRRPYTNNPDVHPWAPGGSGGQGFFDRSRAPRPLDVSYYLADNSNTVAAPPVPPKDLGKGNELNVVATYSPFWKTQKERWDAVELGGWGPDTKDLISVISQGIKRQVPPTTVEKPNDLLAAIDKHYGRINFFTHANESAIGFAGKIVSHNVKFTRLIGLGSVKSQFTPDLLKSARKLLKKNSLLIIYGCDAGASEPMIQEIADTLGIWVGAFKDEIHYHPYRAGIGGRTTDRESIDAKETIYLAIGKRLNEPREPPSDEVTDFHKLTPQILLPPKRSP